MAGVCPAPRSARATSATASRLGSEINETCHQVRDGVEFRLPGPSREYETVIVGGGPSGLMAAYKLQHVNFLLLEKEPRLGGNALSEEWKGQWYSTGAAYTGDEKLEALCVELGMKIHRIRSVDAAIIHDELVPEFWTGGFWKAPFGERVARNFAQFLADMKALDTRKNAAKLDNMSFAELLKPYGLELKLWFDNFGPNNWGADSENTSALIGAESARWGGGVEPNRFTWPGGLGRISQALEAALEKSGRGRIRKGATAVQVKPEGSSIHVSYIEDHEPVTIAARTVIIACPKFIGKKIIQGLDEDHYRSMNALRYAPYLVVNLCAREVIYNGSYDTNIPAPSLVVDFNVADWVLNRDNAETKRPQVLTCFVPRPESDRAGILKDEYCLEIGQRVVERLGRWFPGAQSKIDEVRIYRRGHPMFLSAPGVLTRLVPKIRQPLGNIFFAHSDSEGGVSEYAAALRAAERTSREVLTALEKESSRRAVHALGPPS